MLFFFIMVIDCSQITPLLCGIQNLTAVLTPIILSLLQKKNVLRLLQFPFIFRLQTKGNVCIVSLLCKVLVCKQAPVKDEKKKCSQAIKVFHVFFF